MELLDNYNKSLRKLLEYLKFPHGDDWCIRDNTDCYWHFTSEHVVYSLDKESIDNPFSSLMIPKSYYKVRVFGGKELTAIITGRPTHEILMIFDNSKYTGDKNKEKQYV